MKVRVHEIDVETDRPVILPLLRANLPLYSDDERYDWLYLRNPFGRARAWLAEDAEGKPIGVAGAFPRLMHVRGADVICWNLGDFAIDEDHRSLGPAVSLQRACLQEVMEGHVPFAYDHPSSTMMAVYRWMKIPTTSQVVRYAKLLRVDDKVRGLLKDGFVSRGVSGIGNVLLTLTGRGLSVRSGDDTRTLKTRFDDKFTNLDRRLMKEFIVGGARSAEYLNWRYLDNPTFVYEIVTVDGDGGLRGYSVCRRDGQNATLCELYTEPDHELRDALLAGVVDKLRANGIQTLSAPVLESSPMIKVLEDWGFRARESAEFVVSTRPGGKMDGISTEATNWFRTDGDRDV